MGQWSWSSDAEKLWRVRIKSMIVLVKVIVMIVLVGRCLHSNCTDYRASNNSRDGNGNHHYCFCFYTSGVGYGVQRVG